MIVWGGRSGVGASAELQVTEGVQNSEGEINSTALGPGFAPNHGAWRGVRGYDSGRDGGVAWASLLSSHTTMGDGDKAKPRLEVDAPPHFYP